MGNITRKQQAFSRREFIKLTGATSIASLNLPNVPQKY
jgi:hypothetical protein